MDLDFWDCFGREKSLVLYLNKYSLQIHIINFINFCLSISTANASASQGIPEEDPNALSPPKTPTDAWNGDYKVRKAQYNGVLYMYFSHLQPVKGRYGVQNLSVNSLSTRDENS